MIKKNSIIGDIIEQIRESKSSESGMFGDEIGLPIDAEEGTDASAVSTPTGVVGGSEGIVCPKCGSHDVNIHNNGNDFYCVKCGATWPVQDSNANGVDDDEEPVKEAMLHVGTREDDDSFSGLSPLDGDKHVRVYYNQFGAIVAVGKNDDDEPTIEVDIPVDAECSDYYVYHTTQSKVRDTILKVANSLAKKLKNSKDIDDAIKKIGNLGYITESGSNDSSVDLEVGKAYKTNKGVQFEVRKIDKRGTATIYDFDQGAEYKVTKKQLAKLKIEEIHEGRTGFRKTMDSIIDSFCD